MALSKHFSPVLASQRRVLYLGRGCCSLVDWKAWTDNLSISSTQAHCVQVEFDPNVCFTMQERSGSEAGDVSGGTPRSARSQPGGKGGAVASNSTGGKTLWKG